MEISEKPAAPALAHERSNVVRLAIGRALAGANASVVYATAAVVGNSFTPDKTLATLPISLFVVGMAVSTIPAGWVAQRYGRRTAFLLGALCGVLVGLLSALAAFLGSFWVFCLATPFGGAYAAVVLSFRFAAADCVPVERRARALSAVMAGGVAAGVIGPQLVTLTMDWWAPYLFVATYLAQAAVAVLCGIILLGVRLPAPKASESTGGRPLGEIMRQPQFVGAVTAAVISYLIMNLVMTSAPLAMRLCGHSQSDANLGLQWHVIAMYAPSFFTGRIIARFGTAKVVVAGLIITAMAAGVGVAGITVGHFWLTLVLLGLGWNFGFVGASAMVLETHRPEERLKVQSANDFLVFGIMVAGSFASGGLLNSYGWETVCLVSFPPLLIAGLTLWIAGRYRTQGVAS